MAWLTQVRNELWLARLVRVLTLYLGVLLAVLIGLAATLYALKIGRFLYFQI